MDRALILPRRSDLPSGYLQIKDLYPNKSQYSPSAGKRLVSNKLYITQPQAFVAPNLAQDGEGNYYFVEDYTGLAAALFLTKTNNDWTILSSQQLQAIHDGILEVMYNGGDLTPASLTPLIAANISPFLDWVSSSFGPFNGLFGTTEVLYLLAGTPFVVPAGTRICGANGVLYEIDLAPFFLENLYSATSEPAYSNRSYMVEDSFKISYLKGNLSEMLSNHFKVSNLEYTTSSFDEQYVEGAGIQIYLDNGLVFSFP